MCEVIIYGDDNYDPYSEGWTAEDKQNALAHLRMLESFNFIYALATLQRTLLYLREAAVNLQGVKEDIASGVALVHNCLDELKRLRCADIEQYSEQIFQHSSQVAAKSGVTPCTPRMTQQQLHRMNVQGSYAAEYLKQTITIPFLDHLITDLTSRFAKHVQKVAFLQGLLPRSISPASSVENIQEAI